MPPLGRPGSLALQGLSRGFLGDIGHPVRLAQAAAQDLPDGDRGILQRGEGQKHARLRPRHRCAIQNGFVLAHKLREAMASSTKAMGIGGEGRTAEIDGAYFGGHIRPENLAIDRIDRRLAEHQSGKRQVVVAMRERGGRTLAQVFPAEADAVAAIRQRVAKGTTVHADESAAWNPLHASFAMQRINHQCCYVRFQDAWTKISVRIFRFRLTDTQVGYRKTMVRRGPASVFSAEVASQAVLRGLP